MIKDFIDRHRALAIILFFVVVIGVVTTSIIINVKNNTASTGDTGDSIDGYRESEFHGYSNMLYTISAVSANSTITINAYSGYKNAAVNQISNAGFDPTNYKKVFNNESPFKAYE
jgi:hypothetical protein